MIQIARSLALGLFTSFGLFTQAYCSSNAFLYGVGTHFPSNPDIVAESMTLIQEAGLNSYRDDVYWHIVEKRPGVFGFPDFYEQPVMRAKGAGISPMLILGRMGGAYKWQGGWTPKPLSEEKRKAFARYAAAVAGHYRGRVSLFELWNEWNHKDEPKTLEPYLALLEEVVPAVRRANPEARLLLGSSDVEGIERTWIPKLLAYGVNELVDGYSIHPYVHCEGKRKATPEGWFEWLSATITRLNTLVDGNIRPFYITEMSWPSHQGACGISEVQQANYLAKVFVLAPFIPHVKGLWWYDFHNDGSDPKNMEHNFGLVAQDLRHKAAYQTAKSLVPVLKGSVALRLVRLDSLWLAMFRGDKGQAVVAAWQERQSASLLLKLGPSARDVETLKLTGNGWVATEKGSHSIGTELVIFKGRDLAFEIFKGTTLLRKFDRDQ